MSQPIAETYVTIRPQLAPGFEGDVKKLVQADVDKATKNITAKVGADITAGQANRQALQVQSQLSNLGPLIQSVGPVGAAGGIESTRRNLIELERLAKIYPELALGTAQARAQFDKLTVSEVKNTVATEANRVEQARNARTQAATGLRSNLLNVFRQGQSGSDIGQLAAFGAKAGLVGFAITSVYQAVSKLREGLRVTGVEAGTTAGKLRNFGAAILGGDVIGSLEALAVKATLSTQAMEDLQAQIANADFSNLKKQFESTNQGKGRSILDLVTGKQDIIGFALGEGTENTKKLQQLQDLQARTRLNLISDQATAASITPGLKDDLASSDRAVREAESQVRQSQKGTDRYTKAFQIYAKAVKEQQSVKKQIEQGSSPLARDAARDAQFQLNIARAQQTKGTGNDKAILEGRRNYLKAQIANLEAEGATTTEAKTRLTSLYGQLDSASDQITSLQKQSLADRQAALQEQISLQQTELQIQEARARTEGQTITALNAQRDLDTKLAGDKRLDAQARAGYELQAAQLDRQVYDINKAAAERAAAAAKAAAAQREQERKEALAKLKAKREEALQLKELILQNAIAAAGLTKSTKDDKKRIQQEIAYYKERVKNTKGLEREQERSKLISARGSLKSLTDSGRSSQGATTAEFFAKAAQQFGEFGSNIADRNGILSGQDARGAFAQIASGGIAGAIASGIANAQRPALTEAQKQTMLLRRIADGVKEFGTPGAVKDRRAINNARAKAAHLGGV